MNSPIKINDNDNDLFYEQLYPLLKMMEYNFDSTKSSEVFSCSNIDDSVVICREYLAGKYLLDELYIYINERLVAYYSLYICPTPFYLGPVIVSVDHDEFMNNINKFVDTWGRLDT